MRGKAKYLKSGREDQRFVRIIRCRAKGDVEDQHRSRVRGTEVESAAETGRARCHARQADPGALRFFWIETMSVVADRQPHFSMMQLERNDDFARAAMPE